MHSRYLFAAALLLPCHAVLAEDAPKAIIAVVGDADRFTIGQEGFCGARTDIDAPSGKKFKIPADKTTHFYIQSRFHVPTGIYTCEGEYSFIPSPGMLHIIRFTFGGKNCTLEMFKSEPGGAPKPAGFHSEPMQNCLINK